MGCKAVGAQSPPWTEIKPGLRTALNPDYQKNTTSLHINIQTQNVSTFFSLPNLGAVNFETPRKKLSNITYLETLLLDVI